MIPLALLAGAGVLLAVISPEEVDWFPRCAFREATGWKCPGCGGTRAIHAALSGQLGKSVSLNLLAVPLALLAGYPLARLSAKGLFGWRWPPLPRAKAFWSILALVVFGFGIARNFPGSPFP